MKTPCCSNWATGNSGGQAWKWPTNQKKSNLRLTSQNSLQPEADVSQLWTRRTMYIDLFTMVDFHKLGVRKGEILVKSLHGNKEGQWQGTFWWRNRGNRGIIRSKVCYRKVMYIFWIFKFFFLILQSIFWVETNISSESWVNTFCAFNQYFPSF